MRPYVRQLLLGPMDNFVYLVGAAQGSTCAVVDAAWDVPTILAAAAADGRTITHALVTHGHHDHVNGLTPLLERQGVQVIAHREELGWSEELRALGSAVRGVGAGEELDVGGLRIGCLHTPGHTPGCVCYHLGDCLCTGDTLFVGACGRCDLPGSDPQAMFDSLARLKRLDPATELLPGHDYGDTPTARLGDELTANPYLAESDRAAWVRYRMRPRT